MKFELGWVLFVNRLDIGPYQIEYNCKEEEAWEVIEFIFTLTSVKFENLCGILLWIVNYQRFLAFQILT